jgi:hypothetical protein
LRLPLAPQDIDCDSFCHTLDVGGEFVLSLKAERTDEHCGIESTPR